MATKAEQARAESEKKGPNPKRAKKAAQKKAPKKAANTNKAAGKKATFAKETVAPGKRPSRKSTRSSANRSKGDTNQVLRSERAKRSPETTARTAKRRASRTRGKPTT